MSTPTTPPQHCPSQRELDDLELLVSGALSPITAYDEPGSPVTLSLPAAVEEQAVLAGSVELVDPEGLPLARVTVPGGAVEALTHAQFGPFRRLYLSPAVVREEYAGRTFVPVADALTDAQLAHLAGVGPLVLLALVGDGTPDLSPTALIRATLAAADQLPVAAVVAVPLASHGDPDVDHALGVQVVATYASGDPVLGLPDGGDLTGLVAEIVDQDQPPPHEQGLVLFFTGLSGSGKSTLARALMDRLLEQGGRTVTSLDGDVVRRNLSAGLTFSKADRETNIRRIGWVAAEISRHRGVAVVSPIAPFDETRQQVRAMVDDAGGAFFLVHVATPLEECERRDRKGLYAKARRGEIPEFTGISSPYEEPEDADVRVDTTGRTIEAALDDVVDALRDSGYLDLTTPAPMSPPPVEQRAPASVTRPGEPTAETTAGAPASPKHKSQPLKILFVCTANICRSPYMELMARHLLGDDPDVHVSSAGTRGFQDRAMDDVMAAQLPTGIDATTFSSRPVTRDVLAEADLVITAEASHRAFILDDHPALFRRILTLGQLAETVERGAVTAGLSREELLQAISTASRGSAPTLDVSDPYRRGEAAAQACATRIDGLLQTVVPVLSVRKTTA